MKITNYLAVITFTLLMSCTGDVKTSDPFIIPEPATMSVSEGVYTLKSNVSIAISDESIRPAASLLQSMITTSTGFKAPISNTGDIKIELDPNYGTSSESYSLKIDKAGISIKAKGYGGVIYAIETLRQLLPREIETQTTLTLGVPFVNIEDAPRFAWRGFMLDVSRHFYTPTEVKEVIDMMAFYKLNKFHWHLTDDQGWRIEIKQYPLLTEKGAWRHFNNHDRDCQKIEKETDNQDYIIDPTKIKVVEGDSLYGGFYTQDEIRDIVEYARVRNIDVIPEIDMPGHFLSAISNYNGISCFEEHGWGETFTSPICPGKDSALDFCKNVYNEVFGLFPYEYIHLGADEVEKLNWEKCPDCQKRMKANKLKNEHELQSWFVKTMEKHFIANGKKLIGWDEIIEGGLSETATIMWWRNWAPKSIPTATAQGNQVITTPCFTLYFDAQQDKNTLKNVYNFNPIPEGLTDEQANLILGPQANLWCEWIPSMARAEYMMFPRVLALSEIAWSAPDKRDWNKFVTKVVAHMSRFDAMGINYRTPDLEGFNNTNTFIKEGVLDIKCAKSDIEIRYTTDGSIPTIESPKYTEPIKVTETTDFSLRSFRPNGTKGDIVKTRINIEEYSPSTEGVTLSGEGLKAKWYNYKGMKCAEIESAKLNKEIITEGVMIPEGVTGNIGLIFEGYYEAPEDGIYTFALLSDDGSMMYVDDAEIISNDGGHSPREIIGQKALRKGLHKVKVLYFDSNGGVLELKTLDNNDSRQPFPNERFKH